MVGPGRADAPANEVLADAEHVLIPKFSTYGAWTERARLEYGPYLSENFRGREETQSWLVLSRRIAARPGLTEPPSCDMDRPLRIAAPPF